MPQGFAVITYAVPGWKSFDWREFTIDGYVDTPHCPIHGTTTQRIASIVGVGTGDTLHVTCCVTCGLIGYSRRPRRERIAEYYRSTWMGETVEQATEKALAFKSSQPSIEPTAHPNAAVLEIGAGYGNQVASFLNSGYRNVEACEACPARAQAVQSVFGIPVHGDIFSVPSTKTYDAILSVHVLEHIAEPVAFVQKCYELQKPGGELVISVPNFYHEPSVGVLLFWPHLWSFTGIALSSLLNYAGYIVTKLRQGSSIEIVAIKAENHESVKFNARQLDALRTNHNDPTCNHVELAINKHLVGLGLVHHGARVLTWQKSCDGVATRPAWHDDAIDDTNRFDRTMLVRPIEQFVTDSPIEIQFPKGIQLFYK